MVLAPEVTPQLPRRSPDITIRPGPLTIAHRGASALAPEHTFAAYDLAVAQGADYIELDLQMTSDGTLVALHDHSLERTARGRPIGCSGAVGDKNIDEVKTCDVGSWFNVVNPSLAQDRFVGLAVPSLDEVFERYGRTVRYYIEPKHPHLYPGMEEELLATIDRWNLTAASYTERAVMIQSFHDGCLKKLHALDPKMPLVRLYPSAGHDRFAGDASETARFCVAVAPWYADVTRASIEAARAEGLEVHAYTVNDFLSLKRMMTLNVDGIFTDVPHRLNALCSSLHARAVNPGDHSSERASTRVVVETSHRSHDGFMASSHRFTTLPA